MKHISTRRIGVTDTFMFDNAEVVEALRRFPSVKVALDDADVGAKVELFVREGKLTLRVGRVMKDAPHEVCQDRPPPPE